MTAQPDEVQRLRTAVEELSVLNEIALAVGSARELDDVVELIIQKCVKHLNVEQGAVMLLNEAEPDAPFQTMVRKMESRSDVVPYHFGVQLSGWMLKNQTPLLVDDFQKDERFRGTAKGDFPVQSLLSVPLRLKGRMIGLLNVFNKRGDEGFHEEDQRLLSIIATQSAQVIENARLYEEEQQLFRMEEELRVATKIQTKLLPGQAPVLEGYDIGGRSVPAKEVGGDYYDFIPVDENQLAICLADVSGKGMPAALLMANLQATIRGQTVFFPPCNDCVRRSNRLLFRSTDPGKFATMFYGVLDTEKHELCYTNAGHNNPYLFREDGNVRRLEIGGTVLGFLEDAGYEEETIPLRAGDVLVVFSDGATEAMSGDEEEFGEERLRRIVVENLDLPSEKLMDKIVSAVQSHAVDTPQTDDISLVIIKRNRE